MNNCPLLEENYKLFIINYLLTQSTLSASSFETGRASIDEKNTARLTPGGAPKRCEVRHYAGEAPAENANDAKIRISREQKKNLFIFCRGEISLTKPKIRKAGHRSKRTYFPPPSPKKVSSKQPRMHLCRVQKEIHSFLPRLAHLRYSQRYEKFLLFVIPRADFCAKFCGDRTRIAAG